MSRKFKSGDRVFYRDTGPSDIGTVIGTRNRTIEREPDKGGKPYAVLEYEVRWDKDGDEEFDYFAASQLCKAT